MIALTKYLVNFNDSDGRAAVINAGMQRIVVIVFAGAGGRQRPVATSGSAAAAGQAVAGPTFERQSLSHCRACNCRPRRVTSPYIKSRSPCDIHFFMSNLHI